MPVPPQSSSPPRFEGDAFLETAVQLIDSPADRAAMRRIGRLLYRMAVEVSQDLGTADESSLTRAELRAVAADFRYLSGYLRQVERAAEENILEASDEELTRFAGELAGEVDALVERIERRLS